MVSKGTINGDQVRIRYFDGTSKLVTISDNTTVALTAGTAYKVSGADTSMKFENVSSIKYNGYLYEGAGNADPSNDMVTIPVPENDAKQIKVDDSASVILYDGNGRSKMLTGKQYNALSTATSKDKPGLDGGTNAATAIFTKETKGLTRAMMVAVKTPSMTISGNSSDNYAYVVSNNGQNKDGNASYTIWTTDNKYVDVIEENATAMAKGELIGYSSIDSNGVIKDVSRIANIDDVGTTDASKQIKANTVTDTYDTEKVYYGSNRSDDTKFITINDDISVSNNKKFKVTADTAVLFVDSAADEDNQIGVNYTYGTTAMAKAEEYDSNSYSYNVMFMVDEAKSDDANLKVLVVDTTGAFKGQKHNDSDNSNKNNTDVSKTGNITIKATGLSSNDVKASIDTANKLVVAVPKTDNLTVTVTVNGIDKVLDNINAPETSTQKQYTINNVSKDDTVIVTVTKGA